MAGTESETATYNDPVAQRTYTDHSPECMNTYAWAGCSCHIDPDQEGPKPDLMTDCWCTACNVNTIEVGGIIFKRRMILCPQCGNKRCPRASDHRNECTGSNEPGQEGSLYA